MRVVKGSVVLLAVIAIVVFWQARLRRAEPSQDAAAIRALRTISSAQSAYATASGTAGYAPSLATLGTPCEGATHAFLPADLAKDPLVSSGYEFRLHVKPDARPVSSDCHGAVTYSGYYVTAAPVAAGPGKSRSFATDETGGIWFDEHGVPPTPPFAGARVVR